MPLLEINPIRRVSATVRLDATTAAQLDQYAGFLRVSADEVVEKALGYIFTKDREFQEFLRSPEAEQVRPSLRIRHGNGKDALKARKNGAGPVEVRARS